jgi:hypothetical protein
MIPELGPDRPKQEYTSLPGNEKRTFHPKDTLGDRRPFGGVRGQAPLDGIPHDRN